MAPKLVIDRDKNILFVDFIVVIVVKKDILSLGFSITTFVY